jgi:hypothetical protein
MIKQINLLFLLALLLAAGTANAYTRPGAGIDPHDSLLFDDGSFPEDNNIFFGELGCFTRVEEVTGNVIGKVLKREIYQACGENETVYTAEERLLKKGDKLLHGSEVITSVDSKVELSIVLMESTYHRVSIKVGPESQITTPSFVVECKIRLVEKETLPPEEIKVIKGIITYDAPPDAEPKAITKGKRTSVKHTKTRYSHEMKITGNDTLEVIRVYEGSAEVTMENIDIDEGSMSKQIEALGEDMKSGKLSAEEVQEKMKAFQNIGEMVNELMKPVSVDEGYKCTVTKSTRVVEPLGPDDAEIK